jgi:hypothetical protein
LPEASCLLRKLFLLINLSRRENNLLWVLANMSGLIICFSKDNLFIDEQLKGGKGTYYLQVKTLLFPDKSAKTT